MDPARLPPGAVLESMTQTQLVRLAHDLAVVENNARRAGLTALAADAKAARETVGRIYTAYGTRDLSALDKAAALMDRVNQAVAGAARDVIVGAASAAGTAAGAVLRPIAGPLLPLALGVAALWLFGTPAGRAVSGRRR